MWLREREREETSDGQAAAAAAASTRDVGCACVVPMPIAAIVAIAACNGPRQAASRATGASVRGWMQMHGKTGRLSNIAIKDAGTDCALTSATALHCYYHYHYHYHSSPHLCWASPCFSP